MDSPHDDGPCEVTITAPDRDWLQGFVRQLVQDGQAAAAHLDAMHTTYRWAGAVWEAQEARARLHTTIDRVESITALCRDQHPYEVPCVVAQRIAAGTHEYLAWISTQTHQ